MSYAIPDLLGTHNNGTLFLRPNPNGRLARFVRTNDKGHSMGWVFGTIWPNIEIDSPIRFGVLAASYEDWHELKQLMADRGITFGEGGDFVPFSNGPTFKAVPAWAAARYDEAEMRLVRKDFAVFFAQVMTGAALKPAV